MPKLLVVRSSRRSPTDHEVVNGIREVAGDGYCTAYSLHLEPFRQLDRRSLGRALRRAANRGLILERQGPDGRRYVAVAAEGWRLIGEGSTTR
jgi:hypothetical protein